MPKTIWSCDACGTSFWSDQKPAGQPWLCPNCMQGPLTEAGGETVEQLAVPEPEGIIPFSFPKEQITNALIRYVNQIPFRPRDLTAENLATRLQKVYMPQWWVDVDVQAQWQAEAGYDYQVVSHKEAFKGQWVSQEVKETRVRWEPRVGLLTKHYDNLPAPALQDPREFEAQVGRYTLSEIQAVGEGALEGTLIRIAQRDTKDAWPQAELVLRAAAGEECRQACKANDIRQFQWTPEVQNSHWTQLLLPVYVTYYVDQNQRRRWVMINGQTGKISGDLLADLNQAIGSALRYLAVGGGLLILGLILSLLGIPALANLLVLIGIGVGCFAFYPFGRAWLFNKNQHPDTTGALT
jgi:hypothetical protein